MGTSGSDFRNWAPPGGWGTAVSIQSGTLGSSVQYDSGWSAQYDAVGDLLGVAFNAGYARATVAPAAVAASTGVNPVETSYSLYGHPIPLSVLGIGRIGGDIIAGPYVENGLATFCISFGVPADPSGTRTLKEIAFDSEVVWENGAFNTEGFTFRFYGGSLTQPADPIEIAHWGIDAVAYRPQILLWFENLPLASTKFGKIPYVAALISDTSGDDVNLGEAFTRLALSPWVGYTAAEFETIGITDGLVDGGLIIVEETDFLSLIQQFGRFYTTWDILQTDKLRIVDRGSIVTADITLDKTRLMGSVTSSRRGADSVKKELELSTIDPDADYTIVPSTARRPFYPVPVTTSVGKDTAYLPAIMDSYTRTSLVTFAKYHEEVTRKAISGTAMAYGLEIEPGTLISIADLSDDFYNEIYKVRETLHGVNYAVEFSAESLLKCALAAPDPYWIYVVLLMGYDGPHGSQGSPGYDDESLKHNSPFVDRTFGTDSYCDTSQFKFGTASLRGAIMYGGTHTNDFDLSDSNSDQFTVEAWARLDNSLIDEVQVIVGASLTNVPWFFAVDRSELRFGFQPVGNGFGGSGVFTNIVSGTAYASLGGIANAGIVGGIWYHFAVDKDGTGKIRLYVNGVMLGNATPIDSNIDYEVIHGLDIGVIGLFGTNRWIGNIDELRITKGIARYASDSGFAVPTSAYTRGDVL